MKDAAALEDLLPARALGALDGGDREAVERALAGAGPGSDLERRAASWARELEALADIVTPIAPAVTTRARLLQKVAGAPVPPADVARSASTWWLRVAAAALLAVAVWGTVDRLALRRELADLGGRAGELQANVATLRQRLEDANGQIVRLQVQSRIVSAPDMHPVVLAGLATAPSSAARTFVSPRDGKALFFAYGLPAAPLGKQYQLWFIAAGKPVSGGVFDVDAAGNGSLLVENVAPLASIQAWAVTLEPAGGLPAPSGAMVLKG